MDEDAPLGTTQSASDWEAENKKREDEERKQIASLIKDNPDNSVLKAMDKDEQEEKMEDQMEKNKEWDLVSDACYAARRAFMDKDGQDFKSVITDLCEALEAIAGIQDDSEYQQMKKVAKG